VTTVRAQWGAAALGALAALIAQLSYWGFTVDDALISARVAHHLHDGAGYRFNLNGPIVDAVTPLGWALLLAPFAKSPLTALAAARYLGAFCFLGVGALLGRDMAVLGDRCWRFLPLLVLALCAPLGAWAAAGMETGLIILLCTVAVLQTRIAPAALCLAVFARPELLPWAFSLSLGFALMSRRPRLQILLNAALPWLAIAAAAIIRIAIFGQAAPLSVLAKPADWDDGWRYLLGSLLLSGPPWLLLGNFGRITSRLRVVAGAAGVHFLAVGMAGGDWMPFYRLMAPVLPGVLLVGSAIAQQSTPWRNTLRVGLATLVCGAALLTHAPAARNVMDQRLQLIDAASRLITAEDRVLTADAGWLGAASSATIVDLSGVTDPQIARLPGGHTSKRLGNDFLLRSEPTVVVLLTSAGAERREPWQEVPFDRVVEQRVALQARRLGLEAQAVAWLPLAGTPKHYVAVRLPPVR
jgi:hypothetical protein